MCSGDPFISHLDLQYGSVYFHPIYPRVHSSRTINRNNMTHCITDAVSHTSRINVSQATSPYRTIHQVPGRVVTAAHSIRKKK